MEKATNNNVKFYEFLAICTQSPRRLVPAGGGGGEESGWGQKGECISKNSAY